MTQPRWELGFEPVIPAEVALDRLLSVGDTVAKIEKRIADDIQERLGKTAYGVSLLHERSKKRLTSALKSISRKVDTCVERQCQRVITLLTEIDVQVNLLSEKIGGDQQFFFGDSASGGLRDTVGPTPTTAPNAIDSPCIGCDETNVENAFATGPSATRLPPGFNDPALPPGCSRFGPSPFYDGPIIPGPSTWGQFPPKECIVYDDLPTGSLQLEFKSCEPGIQVAKGLHFVAGQWVPLCVRYSCRCDPVLTPPDAACPPERCYDFNGNPVVQLPDGRWASSITIPELVPDDLECPPGTYIGPTQGGGHRCYDCKCLPGDDEPSPGPPADDTETEKPDDDKCCKNRDTIKECDKLPKKGQRVFQSHLPWTRHPDDSPWILSECGIRDIAEAARKAEPVAPLVALLEADNFRELADDGIRSGVDEFLEFTDKEPDLCALREAEQDGFCALKD